MKQLRKSRFWLLTTAALIFGSHISATAQVSNVYQPGNYQAGAPTIVAAAPSLPNIPADQIARDVAAEFNPRTGRTELIAAPFDPFEADPQMAGSLRLRSADGVVAIDGQTLQNGALVEIDFYYNSPSDDPYGGRNYSDASFVNGDLAPVVLRDTRILECSTRVEEVAYYHDSYYSPTTYSRLGIYQPHRHYIGHSSFGFGFGSNYFGPGISFFNTNRSRINRNRSRNLTRSFLPRANLPNAGFRGTPARRNRVVTPSRFVGTTGATTAVGANRETATTPNTQAAPAHPSIRERRNIQNRIGVRGRRLSADDFRVNTDQAGTRTSPAIAQSRSRTPVIQKSGSNAVPNQQTSSPARSRVNTSASRLNSTRGPARSTGSQRGITQPTSPKQSAPRVTTPKQSTPQRSTSTQTKTPSRSTSSRSSSGRSSTSRSSSSRSTPSRSTSSRSSSSTRRSTSSTRRSTPRSSSSSRRSSSTSSRRQLNFFPNGGGHVVSSASVDCAREDKLTVFIPNGRLDAATYDGLTIIALDAQGGETPIFIPPNYIEGYRLAATGRVQPQGIRTAPQPQQTQPIQPQRPLIEAAPCPAGTQKQPNGTCLQTSLTGFPVR